MKNIFLIKKKLIFFFPFDKIKMENILLYFQGSYLLVAILIILTVTLLALYDTLFQVEISTTTYLSISLLIGIVGTFIVYVNTLKAPEISEEIIKGPPTF